jgi:pimeloyl-ACP methyl ester carboxylesterase
MLPEGMSRADFKTIEGPNPSFDVIIAPVYDGAGTLVDREKAGSVFAQLSPPITVAAAMARIVVEPHGPRSTPLRLSEERFGSIPRTYIECTADRTIPLPSQRKMQELVPGATVISLWADHSPYLSRPHALATELMAIALEVNR